MGSGRGRVGGGVCACMGGGGRGTLDLPVSFKI